jgi:hypothetical protein
MPGPARGGYNRPLTRADLRDDGRPFPRVAYAMNVCPVCRCRMTFRVIVYADRVVWEDRRGHAFDLSHSRTPATAAQIDIDTARILGLRHDAARRGETWTPAHS